MLFNSLEFFFGFLPVVLAGFLILGRWGRGLFACGWLALGSIFFYAYWAPEYLVLLLSSTVLNFTFGAQIQRALARCEPSLGKRWLVLALVLNLSALAYFKYANFFVDNLNLALGSTLEFAKVTLPIGISFFTFTQIAYLVSAIAPMDPLEDRRIGSSA